MGVSLPRWCGKDEAHLARPSGVPIMPSKTPCAPLFALSDVRMPSATSTTRGALATGHPLPPRIPTRPENG